MFLLGLTPRAMRLYKEVRKRCPKVALMQLDVSNLSEILKDIIEDSERKELERKRREKMRILKEQARHFEPYVPKLTSSHNLKKQSSVSVLQSFTSAMQQLYSPEPSPTKISPKKAISTTSGKISKCAAAGSAAEKDTTPAKSSSSLPVRHCIDLITLSDSDDEMELRNHIR